MKAIYVLVVLFSIGCGSSMILTDDTSIYDNGILLDKRAKGKLKAPGGLELEGEVSSIGDYKTVDSFGNAINGILANLLSSGMISPAGALGIRNAVARGEPTERAVEAAVTARQITPEGAAKFRKDVRNLDHSRALRNSQ